jgi:hypothetical protein
MTPQIEFKIVPTSNGPIVEYPDTPTLKHVEQDYFDDSVGWMKHLLTNMVGKNISYHGSAGVIKCTADWTIEVEYEDNIQSDWFKYLIRQTDYANMLKEN